MTITTEMIQKIGTRPIIRIKITTSGGTTDVSSYFKSCGELSVEKSRTGEQSLVSAGDMLFVFSNHDDKFTELDSGSIFYEVTYIGNKISIDFGFKKDDGTTEYESQGVFKIIEVYLSSDNSQCYISARDNIERLNKFILNVPANAAVPVANAANTGNGYVTGIQTKPFGTVTENWTLTCTKIGGASVAEFSVVGSVSGNIGTATSNVEFTTGSKIKFTIMAGGTAWALGDKFTFSTIQNIEYTSLSPIKIIWSLLTGYDYDTDAAEDWLTKTPQLDHTQSAANTDINFPSFTTAITELGSSFNLTGYIKENGNCSTEISGIITHFLGTIFTDADGKISVNTYTPTFGEASPREFSDSIKITNLKYLRSYNDIVNSCTAKYKKTSSWAWSGEAEVQDGSYTKTNSTSITTYGEKTFTISTNWISVNNAAIQWAVDRIIDKFADPPLILDFVTGTDALQTILGDVIQVTDSKTLLSQKVMEVFSISKDFNAKPTHINIKCSNMLTEGYGWAFLGSSINESDHDWSVASSQDYDTADSFEKQFCYLSETGGEGSNPEYYLW
jgi:hypothetical protein